MALCDKTLDCPRSGLGLALGCGLDAAQGGKDSEGLGEAFQFDRGGADDFTIDGDLLGGIGGDAEAGSAEAEDVFVVGGGVDEGGGKETGEGVQTLEAGFGSRDGDIQESIIGDNAPKALGQDGGGGGGVGDGNGAGFHLRQFAIDINGGLKGDLLLELLDPGQEVG